MRGHILRASVGPLAVVVLSACGFVGLNEQDGGFLAPSDSTNAIGPTRFVELVNAAFAIYDRNGQLMSSGSAGSMFGTGAAFVSDPQIVWDAVTQRFFFAAVANKGTSRAPDWGLVYGFSKDVSPSTATDWCGYFLDANYGGELPDFPRLGTTSDFVLLGANRFTGTTAVNQRPHPHPHPNSRVAATAPSPFLGSDVSWVTKPAAGALTTCPAVGNNGIFRSLKTARGNTVTTPVPARETDASATGWILATGDPLPATTVEVFQITNVGGIAALGAAKEIAVASYNDAAVNAPQGGGNAFDVGDSRFTSAWFAPDPARGHSGLWSAQTIAGGAGTQVRWYEFDPANASVDQSGTVSDPQLFVYYPSIAPDRGGGQNGSGMAMVVATSSTSQHAAAAMVHKPAAAATSAITTMQSSSDPWSCTVDAALGACRWGDYTGASPDPVPAATTGSVWLTGQWNTATLWQTYNWHITP